MVFKSLRPQHGVKVNMIESTLLGMFYSARLVYCAYCKYYMYVDWVQVKGRHSGCGLICSCSCIVGLDVSTAHLLSKLQC